MKGRVPRRVLMVSYYFPPLGGIGSIRAASFARHLPSFGWEPTVLAPSRGAYHQDPSLTFGSCSVTRTKSLELGRAAKALTGQATEDGTPVRLGPEGSRLRELARRWLYRPDGQIGWYPFAVSAGRRILMASRFDGIVSSSFPITAHLVARRLARDFNLPWIAEFRDPWGDALPSDDPNRRAFLRLEDRLIREAAAVVTPSPSWGQLYATKGARQTAVITNGCEPFTVQPLDARPGVTLTHVGSFYPDRQDLSPLWPALAQLRASMDLEPLRIRFVGTLPASIQAQIERHGLADATGRVGFVPHARIPQELAAASTLLVAGARDANPLFRGMVPAKIFEYLASGRPIVYVGDPRSDVAGILRSQRGCFVVPPGEVDVARAALREAMALGGVSREIAAYVQPAPTRSLAGLLDAVTRQPVEARVSVPASPLPHRR